MLQFSKNQKELTLTPLIIFNANCVPTYPEKTYNSKTDWWQILQKIYADRISQQT
jgi:hypothetical protein